jgi:protein-tyrosine-phosphatase
MKDKINILFVCKWNRFRSRLAASYFKKINKNKNIKVKSAGIIKGFPVDKNQVKLAKRYGIDIKGRPCCLSSKILKWQDIIVIAADDVPKEIFTKRNGYIKKMIIWKFPDCLKNEKEIINKVMVPLMKKVEELNKDIESGKLK